MKHGTLLAAAVLVGLPPESSTAGLAPISCANSVKDPSSIPSKIQRLVKEIYLADTVPPSASTRPVETVDFRRFETEFEQIELLGKGAFGEVWRCKHRVQGFECAVKIVRFQTQDGDTARQSNAVREADTLHALSHRNIVRLGDAWIEPDHEAAALDSCIRALNEPWEIKRDSDEAVYDTGSYDDSTGSVLFEDMEPQPKDVTEKLSSGPQHEDQNDNARKAKNRLTLYIQTELCRRNTLSHWLDARNVESIEADSEYKWARDAMQIFEQCAAALDYMHSSDWIHRDVKPSNILFGLDGKVRLGDFGLAKELQPSRAWATVEEVFEKPADQSGIVGTPMYAAPEQMLGKTVGIETDIYSLGLVLLELLCPVRTKMERASVIRDLHEHRTVPAALAAFSPELSILVLSMTDSSPIRRPTACDVRNSASAWLSGNLKLAPLLAVFAKPKSAKTTPVKDAGSKGIC